MDRPRIIAVLGMHRSGTSVVARSLKTLSVDLGDNLMPAITDQNEKGFWEDLDIFRLNERILKKWGSSWNRLSPEDTSALERDALSDERFDASTLLEQKISAKEIFAFKDPRNSILVQFWKRIFEDLEVRPSYIIVVRNPLEVAASLKKRNGFETGYSLSLWLKYMMSAIVDTQDAQRVFVSYPRLLKDPMVELTRISNALDLPAPQPSNSNFVEFVGEFLSPELRHNRISDNEVSRSNIAPEVVSNLYKTLLEWGESAPDTKLILPDNLKQDWAEFQTNNKMLLHLSDQLWTNIDHITGRATDAEEALVESSEQVEQYKSEITVIASDLEQAKALGISRENDLSARVKEIEDLKTSLEGAQSDLEIRAKEKNELKAELEQERASSMIRFDHLKQEAAKLRDELSIFQTRCINAEKKNSLMQREHSLLGQKLESERKHFEARERSIDEIVEGFLQRLSEKELTETAAQLSFKERELEEKTIALRLSRHEVFALKSSTSWRLTKPMRVIRNAVAAILRKSLKR